MSNTTSFWPNGARLAVSLSLMFEGGGQPISGAGGVIPEPIEKGVPDSADQRLLRLRSLRGHPARAQPHGQARHQALVVYDRQGVEFLLDVAKEIVRRGHEAAAHDRVWENSDQLPRDQVEALHCRQRRNDRAGHRREADRLECSLVPQFIDTLETLQDLGFLYTIDEPSHDEPFIIPVRGRDFVTVPYTFHMNDISSFPFEGWNPAAYEQALRDEFDQLYEEGARRRRMMVVSEPVRLCRRKAMECQRTALTATNPKNSYSDSSISQGFGEKWRKKRRGGPMGPPPQRTGSC